MIQTSRTIHRLTATPLTSQQLRQLVTSSMNIFDRNVKLIQRNKTALHPNYKDFDYVKEEIGARVADRIFDIKRSFNTILDLGCQRGYVSKHLTKVIFLY
jgi:hypothetical protein